MKADDNNKLLSPEEQRFVDRVADHYSPQPMTSAQQVRFDRALEERVARRTPVFILRPAILAAAATAMLIWLTVPYHPVQTPSDLPQRETVELVEDETLSESGETLLSYAYYDADFYEAEESESTDNPLPDEYDDLMFALSLPDV